MAEEEKVEKEVGILDLPKEMQGLVGAILTHSAQQDAHLLQRLMEGYRADARHLRAELAAVRVEIETLCSGRYAPNPIKILNALHPSRAVIDQFLEGDPEDE